MQLIYRGLTYDRHPFKFVERRPFQSVRPSKAIYKLIYRGVIYRVDPSVKQTEVPASSTTYKLIYRGATYLVNRNVQK